VLNEIDPDFIRVRTMTVHDRMELYEDVDSGVFVRQTDDEIIDELKLFIENLRCHSRVISDHMINLLQEIEGQLPEDKEKMLDVIRRFQSLSPEERNNFKLGRRMGIYNRLSDINDASRHREVEKVIASLAEEEADIDDVCHSLKARYM